MARHILVVALVALCLGGCVDAAVEAAAEPEGCLDDGDCGEGRRCTDDGSCVADGVTPPASECGSSDDCRDPPTAVPDLYWDGGGPDEVCTVRPDAPATLSGAAQTRCEETRGELPGLFRCAADAQCESGRCLPLADDFAICLRTCTLDTDCPATDGVPAPRVGFSCAAVALGEQRMQACVPRADGAPELSLCGVDADCAPPGATAHPGLGCRFAGGTSLGLDVLPLCVERPAAAWPVGAACVQDGVDSASCAGGACSRICATSADEDHTDVCDHVTFSACVAPCRHDGDCPDRFLCSTGADAERVGRWVDIPAEQLSQPGRSLRLCTLPSYGCLDELDCCPERRPDGSCVGGWSEFHERCALSSELVGGVLRLRTLCEVPAPMARPGDCCASHDDCDTRLCVPARAGSACDGRGVCTTPCAPGTDVEGAPRAARDRCAAALSGSDYHRDSHCAPFDYDGLLPDAAGALQPIHVTLPVCR